MEVDRGVSAGEWPAYRCEQKTEERKKGSNISLCSSLESGGEDGNNRKGHRCRFKFEEGMGKGHCVGRWEEPGRSDPVPRVAAAVCAKFAKCETPATMPLTKTPTSSVLC